MNTHELAQALLEEEPGEVTASVDMSTGEHNAFHRVFGSQLESIQVENDGSVTLLFTSGEDNEDK